LSPENADYPVMIRCPGCSYLVPQTWDTCRRCGTMIRAQAPVVAAAASIRVGGPPPPLPTLSPRSAAPTRPNPARPSTVGPPTAPPLDEFLPAATQNAPAATAPRDVEDLLPLIPAEVPISKQKFTLPKIDRRMALVGAGIVLLFAAIVFVWMQTKDDVHNALNAPVDAVKKAEDVAGRSQLATAQEAAQSVYADQGTFANVTVATLQQAEPGITWVAGNQAAKPGEVSVQVIDADTIVLVTSLPNGSCKALYQGPGGAVPTPATAPCAATNAGPGSAQP
jgi:hypothetical protein